MSRSSEHEENEARAREAQRRSRELDEERSQLHDRVIETAESVRRSHERTAETLDNLADSGPSEHAPRRREAAEKSRAFAEEEARQIAELKDRNSDEATHGSDSDDRPGPDPA
jgi:predicted transcriptional regulator